jgi:hypothetical protein
MRQKGVEMVRVPHSLRRLTVRIGACLAVLSLVASGQIGTGATAAGAQPTGGSIEGRVVLSGTKQPLAGVDIHVYAGPTQVPPLKTDRSGRFRFERLQSGHYGLMLSPMSGYRAGAMQVVLRENQKVTGIEVKAYGGAAISGRVRDAKDRPVAGLVVSALRLHGGGPRFPPDRGMATSTNDLGDYKLTGLNPGRYALLVETRRSAVSPKDWKDDEKLTLPGPAMAEVRTYYPNARSLDVAVPIQLETGQALEGIDLTLTRLETFCVRSRVLDPDAQTMNRIRIQIASEYYLGAANLAEGELTPGGGFEACGLPPGAYSLLASPLARGQDARYASEAFTITDRSLRMPDLSLRPLIQLSGRLTIDASSSNAKPLGGPVSIGLSASGRPGVLDQRSSVRVTTPGPFVIPAVLPAEYWLSVRSPAGFYVKSATVDGRDALREPLHAAGSELHIVLGQDGAQLSVLATGPKNEPLASAAVIAGLDPLPASYAPGDLMSALADQYGQAKLASLAPGRYRVIVFADTLVDPANAISLFLANRVKGEELTLGPGESRSISAHAVDRKE